MNLTDTDITAIRIYFLEDGSIKVHQSRVSPLHALLVFRPDTIGMVERNEASAIRPSGWNEFYRVKGLNWIP